MTISSPPETLLQKEQRLFREGFARLGNALLNKLFELTPKAAARRMTWLIFLFLTSGFIFSLINYPINLWATRLQDIFLYLFNGAYRATYVGNPFFNFILFGLQVFVDPRNLRFVPLLLAPFFISLQSAAIYLADIFELDDVSVARSFVSEVALSGSDETIRISSGEIVEEHRKSPNFLIGGPGKVIVDLDSAALFEKPDGTPHVIGPTGKEPGGKATLEGFERFRQAIDIRDQFIDLRDQDDKSPSVKGRSLDGMPISTTDVRLMFSVHRNGESPTSDYPYPFNKKAIENIVYKAVSRVTPDLANPSTYEFAWIHNMINLVRGELGGFMNQHKLTEYLASTGYPEVEKAKQREQGITEQVRRLIPPTEPPPAPQEVSPAPEFHARHHITNLFSEFTKKFTDNARERGVELHWIGVGTWKTPIENVFDKHLDAWKLSRENQGLGSEDAMAEYESEIALRKMVNLIKAVPISAYHKITKQAKDTTKKENGGKTEPLKQDVLTEEDAKLINKLDELFRSKDKPASPPPPHEVAMKLLLLEYRKMLIEARDFIRSKNQQVPISIEEGIKEVNIACGYKHWAGLS